MKKIYYIILLLVVCVSYFCFMGCEEEQGENIGAMSSESDISLPEQMADSQECYSSVIENTAVFTIVFDNADMTPEKAAYELAVMFMEDMCRESDERSFQITEFKELFVEIYDVLSLDEETRVVYCIDEFEEKADTWLLEISCSYKYIGTISPIGPSQNVWIDVLYQGSPVGFIMQKNGNTYTLQSRYAYMSK